MLVEGLVLTRRAVVERELPFAEGQPFDPDALVEAQRRLGTLGPFDRVDVEPLRPPAEPFADVRVTVRERLPWHDRLSAARADRALAAGLEERTRAASIRRMLAPGARVPLPFTGPP